MSIRSKNSNMKELIFKNNRWWKDKKDPDIKKWESMKIRWIPKWIEKLKPQVIFSQLCNWF